MEKYRQDEELLALLKTGDRRQWKQFFEDHATAFSLFLIKYGQVQRDTALELYQEAIVILHRNITEEKLQVPLRAGLQTYLFGIGKNLCRRKKTGPLHFPEHLPELPEMPFEEMHERQSQAALVKTLLARLDEKCRRFLSLVFLEEMQAEVIMTDMAIPSAEAFRKRKFDCLKKMREGVRG